MPAEYSEKPFTLIDWEDGGYHAVRNRLTRMGQLTMEDLALVLENYPDTMPADLREYFITALRTGFPRKRGRPFSKRTEFRDLYMRARFDKWLVVARRFERMRNARDRRLNISGRAADGGPVEWALEKTAEDLSELFGSISPEGVRNRLSQFNATKKRAV